MEQKCIAVFDDDDDILQVTKIILCKEYQRVEIISTCHNFMEIIERIQPDLILMDIKMPGMSGEQLLESLNKCEKAKMIPVIIFSAANDIEKIAERIHARAIIKKPFSIETLRRTVRQVLS